MVRMVCVLTLATSLAAAQPVPAGSAPRLAAGKVSGSAGSIVSVPISFIAGPADVAAFQCSIGLPSGWSITSVSAGSAASEASKSVKAHDSTGMLMVYSDNQNVISTGVFAFVKVRIPNSTASGTYPVSLNGSILSAPDGAGVKAGTPSKGSITVR